MCSTAMQLSPDLLVSQALTKELLEYLKVCDLEFKPDLTAKVCQLIQRYSPERRWYVDSMLQVSSSIKPAGWWHPICLVKGCFRRYLQLAATTHFEAWVRRSETDTRVRRQLCVLRTACRLGNLPSACGPVACDSYSQARL